MLQNSGLLMYIKLSGFNVDSPYIKEQPGTKGVEGELPFLFVPDASNLGVSHNNLVLYPGVDMQSYVVGLALLEVDGKSAVEICKGSQTLREHRFNHTHPHTPVCIVESIASEDKSPAGVHLSWDYGTVGNSLEHKRNIHLQYVSALIT